MQRFALGIAAIAIAACGDNSDQCGPGTTNVHNVCVPSVPCGTGTRLDPTSGACIPDGSVVCTDGTKLDPATGTCVLDPNACRDGTVLVNNTCQDPTGALVIDVEEGPEPNGMGIIESSTSPAGIIPQLKPIGGSGIVLHGYIAPFHDVDADGLLDPDVDTYLVTASGPTLIRVTVDGVNGMLGAFAVFANVGGASPLRSFQRVGLSLTGDVAKREVFLPAAGTYLFAIGDSRTFFQYTTGGPVDAAPGGGDYYVTIDQLAIPSPDPLTGTVAGTLAAGETRFFAPAMGTGANLVTLAMPYAQSQPGLALLQNGTARALGTTTMLSAGFSPGDTTLIAVDPIYDTANGPVPFTLAVETSDATPLPTDGSSISVTEQRSAGITTPHDVLTTSQFSFEATLPDQTFAIDIAWTRAVRGELRDASCAGVGPQAAPLTGTPVTWTGYRGLVHVPAPGRYYLMVIDPTGTPGTTQLGVTSRIQALPSTTIAIGTPTGNVALDGSFHAGVFDLDAGTTHPWLELDATGAATGGQRVAWFAMSTVGFLDPFVTSVGTAAQAPVFQHVYTEGGGAFGRILLDDPRTHYLVKVDAQTTAAAQTVDLAFADRAFTDLGAISINASASSTDHLLDAANTPGLYLFRTRAGNHATLTVHPQVPASLDTRFVQLDALEAPAGAVVDTSANGDDQTTITAAAWTAIAVDAVTPPASSQHYDVSVSVTGP